MKNLQDDQDGFLYKAILIILSALILDILKKDNLDVRMMNLQDNQDGS